ncbi:hypothetical protein BDN72DRAFT_770676 [Pluteus cervinus]|uniref:Uncharacterized protein n=1 Tax=Pluteus cervinus TaxID=181527 RepID=A0ACD3ANZ3_9AGAR|nr:hypothetical protein BDN72DRAFT_770676 [Pluteus cervinus]
MVELTENDEVVPLMLKYMHKQRHIDIKTLDFNALKGLADAAEKYSIYPAMDICKLRMEYAGCYALSRLRDDAFLDVLGYAAKHSYSDICDLCAPATLGTSLTIARLALGPLSTLKWATYREGFLDILRTQSTPPVAQHVLHKGGSAICDVWKEIDIQSRVMTRVLADPECLLSTAWKDEMIALFLACPYCARRVKAWLDGMMRSASTLPVFSEVVV